MIVPVVTGCARSGTTLLRMMLDTHPDLAIPPETTFLIPTARMRRPWGQREIDALGRLITTDSKFDSLQVDPAEVRRAAGSASSPQGLIRAVFANQASRQGAVRWGLKNPRYILHIRQLARLLPSTRFIHVIRDGHDVAASLRDSAFGSPHLDRAAAQWAHRVRAGRSAGLSLPEDRYLEVRYENLVREVEGTLRRVCDFIELSYDPVMLEYPTRTHRFLTGPDASITHKHLSKLPRPDVRDWRRDLSRSEVSAIERVAGRTLSAFGYATDRAYRAHVGAWARSATWVRETGRVVRADRPLRSLVGAVR